ncbi:DUF4394 domain-containing protein [Thermostichus vulcanus]|uniref:DUF4394 domain-containing protein n=1 Tax=Thermostichus vulcanus str. 'Rupite' TaxID=2813851 RepID=A0ABT0C878_THEVL|nr:DUF4394 domain-containing protein [Thermostichus vulcanus]MCJ2541993.1 DUF4394 domain-containing protein [Thermostichus vulcanus str. 'Rupite']
MRKHLVSLVASGLALLGCSSSNASPMGMIPSQADLVALSSGNRLTLIRSADASVQGSLRVTGVNGNLIGIDVRPANGALYALSDTNILYTINLQTGAATVASRLSVPFTGGSLSGMDFNPVPDRLRLVGANGQNFRINVDTGEVIQDGTLAFAPGELQGSPPAITAAAYTNNVAGAQSTRLLNIDGERNLLVLQNPPNDGVLTPIGPLGVPFGSVGGFDIRTDTNGVDTGFAIGGSTLYRIDLSSGRATTLGTVAGGPFLGLAAL